jgi:hypothetical protein
MAIFKISISIILFLTLSLQSSLGMAFKVDTHVWIAQQIINDLRSHDNTLSIPTKNFGTLIGGLERAHARDILQYPAYFRMGAIGPDAFPGILEGQMIIHPGANDHRWGTGDWLKFLLAKAKPGKERAFVLGFICHAASDIFAHTYVNTYSGGEFDLNNGHEEEERHFILEGYISSRNPAIADESGHVLGLAHQLVMDGNQLAVPLDFVVNQMLYSDEAAEQYAGNPSSVFTGFKRTKDGIHELTRKGGPIDRIEQEIIKGIARYKLDIELNNEQAQKLAGLKNELQKIKNTEIQAIQKLINANDTINKHFIGAQDKFEKAQIELAQKTVNASNRSLELAIASNDKILEYSRQITEKVVRECAKICETKTIKEEHCEARNPLGCIRWVTRTSIQTLHPVECRACTEARDSDLLDKQNLEKFKAEEQRLFAQYEKEVANGFDSLKEIQVALLDARLQTLAFTTQILNEGLAFYETASSADPLRSILNSWAQNIDTAALEYVKANGQVIVNTINPDAEHTFSPLLDWLECQFPKALAVPAVIPNISCATEDYIKNMEKILGRIEASALNAIPIVRDALKEMQNIKNRATDRAKEEVITQLDRMIKGDVKTLADMLQKKIGDRELDNGFSDHQHFKDKGLILFDKANQKMSDRIKLEMKLTPSAQFDKDQYTVILDAIRLSKLALLTGPNLKTLAESVGYNFEGRGHDTAMTTTPYSGAILIQAIRSIDGNHQWLQSAPSIPKAEGRTRNFCRSKRFATQFGPREAIHEESCKNSGYPSYEYHLAPTHGFRPYISVDLRKALFDKIFVEILAPGIEAPKTLSASFDEVLPSDYEYRVCEKQPFPTGNPKDSTCVEQVLRKHMKFFHRAAEVPVQVVQKSEEKVSQKTYSALKPLYSYEEVHAQYKGELATSAAELQVVQKSYSEFQEEVSRFKEIDSRFKTLTAAIFDQTGDLRSVEQQLIDLRSEINKGYCRGNMSGHRAVKSNHDSSMQTYRGLKFKNSLAAIDFSDFEFFHQRSQEQALEIEANYQQIVALNRRAQEDFNGLSVEQVCRDTDIALLLLGKKMDNIEIENLAQEVEALKSRIRAAQSATESPEASYEKAILQIKNRVVDSILAQRFIDALEYYRNSSAEFDDMDQDLFRQSWNTTRLRQLIEIQRADLSDVYDKHLKGDALFKRIAKEQAEFSENADIIPAIFQPHDQAYQDWARFSAQKPRDVTAQSSQDELARALDFYYEANAFANSVIQ